tara:strand:+ start:98 stop:391 length:294 start_codon:yes stop_codon:yes gene_type:complete
MYAAAFFSHTFVPAYMLGSGRHLEIILQSFRAFGIHGLTNSTARAGAGAVLLWLPHWYELIPVRANPPFSDSIISIPLTGLSLPKVWHENHIFAAIS